MGSRILSRSFNVEKWNTGEDEGEGPAENSRHRSEMDVDNQEATRNDDDAPHSEVDEDDADDSSDIAMVPMADMLNARYGSENVFRHEFALTTSHTHCSPLKGKTVLRGA